MELEELKCFPCTEGSTMQSPAFLEIAHGASLRFLSVLGVHLCLALSVVPWSPVEFQIEHF